MVKIALDNITENNSGLFNVISHVSPQNDAVIDYATNYNELSKYAYFSEVPVGVIVAENMSDAKNDAPTALLVSHFAVLEAYSTIYAVESTLIQHVLDLCPKRHVKSCYFVTKKSNTGLVSILQSLGFVQTEPRKPISDSDALFVKTLS